VDFYKLVLNFVTKEKPGMPTRVFYIKGSFIESKLPSNDSTSHVKPLPKAAKTTVSPLLIFPFSHLRLKQLE
jgi:hypothetical protein